jgi:hypothetical protein
VPTTSFALLFGVAWLFAAAYALSAFRLLTLVRRLKEQGRAGDAPDPLRRSMEVFSYLAWLVTGRYAELGDDAVRAWARIARVLFIIAAPLILAVFAIAFTRPESLG